MEAELNTCKKALDQVKKVALKMDHAIEVRQAALALLEVQNEFRPALDFLKVGQRQLLLRRRELPPSDGQRARGVA